MAGIRRKKLDSNFVKRFLISNVGGLREYLFEPDSRLIQPERERERRGHGRCTSAKSFTAGSKRPTSENVFVASF